MAITNNSFDKEIAFLYGQGVSGHGIAEKINKTPVFVYRHLEMMGIKRRNNKINSRIFKCNNNYFDTINSEDKAYWLGFYFADGYQNNQGNFGFSLASKDKEHLEKFKKAIKSTYPIHDYKVVSGYKPGAPYSRMLCRSDEIIRSLNLHGAVAHKALILEFPTTVPFLLIRHFIRGYFDGDGSWTIDKNSSYLYQFKLCGTEAFLTTAAMFLEIPPKLYKKGNSYYLSKAGKEVLRIMNFLYEDTTIYLDRKYQRYLQVLKSH